LLPLLEDGAQINTIFLLSFLIGITLASSAPTVVLFRQNLEKSLRTTFTPHIGGVAIRRIFVVVQFAISTVLMVGIFVVTGQIDYMESKDKGIDIDNVLIVKAPMAKDTTWGAKMKTLQLFKLQCAELPFVTGVASSTTVPSEEYRHETYLGLPGDENKVLVHQNGVDENFFSLYKVQFVAGHDFIPNAKAKNLESIILNESAFKALGFSDINKLLNTKLIDHENPGVAYDVIGVIKDYHQTSLKYEVRPLAFKYNLFRGHCSLRFDARRLEQSTIEDALNSLKDIWKRSYPDASFDYFFLNEKFRAQDQEDQYFALLFQTITILSVILSCLGLFGLSILISTKRQKEVGVRKTFGATSLDILSIFMKGYLGPLATALITGSVCAYFLMNVWLENYANRIKIGPGLIFSAGLTLTTIFIITVSYHTIKAATTNPVKVLRN
jgi:putative ABC transport system permease protein